MSLKATLERIPLIQKKYNIFTSYIKDIPKENNNDGPLKNKIAAIKDNIVTNDMNTTCASQMLSKYKSPYDATVVKLLKESGTTIIGKTNLDEFGMGSLGIHSKFGPVKNPLNENWCIGGSSSGSAGAVASGLVDFALGTDTGGSVRLPSAYSSIMGFKPSYGRISRFGVVAFAQSLDTVGILANNIDTIQKVFGVLDQYDARDPTSLSTALRKDIKTAEEGVVNRKQMNIGIPQEFVQANLQPEIKEGFLNFIQRLLEDGHKIYPVSVPSIKDSLPIYYTLAPAEAASNLARYDGIRYGYRDLESSDIKSDKFYADTRDQFGKEVKNRILLGNYNLCSDGYKNNFIKAQSLRAQLINQFDKIFKFPNVLTGNEITDGKIDMIICPTNISYPITLKQAELNLKESNPLNEYVNDIFTISMSLAGLPTISIPVEKGKPYGIQIAGQYGMDEALLKFIKDLNM